MSLHWIDPLVKNPVMTVCSWVTYMSLQNSHVITRSTGVHVTAWHLCDRCSFNWSAPCVHSIGSVHHAPCVFPTWRQCSIASSRMSFETRESWHHVKPWTLFYDECPEVALVSIPFFLSRPLVDSWLLLVTLSRSKDSFKHKMKTREF